MKAVASPIIEQEMADWKTLGGQNWGIVGAYDGSHPTGFHRAGFEVPTSDYSRRHDPGKPYNMTWSCAGDFAHLGDARLRALHAGLLARLMADDPKLRMIVEFIGQPWAGQPVMYWARWDGVRTLKRYTGKGHDNWSHVSWQRSIAYQRAYLWTPRTNGDDDMFTEDDRAELVRTGTRVTAMMYMTPTNPWAIGNMFNEANGLYNMLKLIADRTGVDADELTQIEAAAQRGAAAAAVEQRQAFIAELVAALPQDKDGNLSVADVEAAAGRAIDDRLLHGVPTDGA